MYFYLPVTIGRDGYGDPSYLAKVHDFSIYNKELSAEEVLYLHLKNKKYLVPGEIKIFGQSDICANGEASLVGFLTYPICATGIFSYQWQTSADNYNWSDISGDTSNVYSPGIITGDTYIRCLVTAKGEYNYSVSTNSVSFHMIGTHDVFAPEISDISPKNCKNDTVLILLTKPNYKNYWYNSSSEFLENDTSYTINNLTESTILFVEAIDEYGCKSDKKEVSIFIDSLEVGGSTTVRSKSIGAESYEWDMGNGFTYTNKEQTVFYYDPGTYDISLTVTSDAGCRDTKTIEDIVIVGTEGLVGENDEFVLVYPIPVKNSFTIDCSVLLSSYAYIYNMNGQVIKEQRLDSTKNVINLSSLSRGTYVLKVISNNGDIYIKQFTKE